MPVRAERRSARDRLLDAALTCFERDGALAATLEQIRVDAGVSTGALYHHFRDKQALAGTLYVRTLAAFQDGFVATLDDNPAAGDGVRAVVHYLLEWGLEHPAEAQVLFGIREAADPEALRAINREFFAQVNRWYQGHVHYGVLRALPLRLLSALWLGPSFEYLRDVPEEIEPPIRNALADAAWRALAHKEQA